MTEKEWQEFYQEYAFFKKCGQQYLRLLKVDQLLEEIRILKDKRSCPDEERKSSS